jgi:hypothetical protein
MNLPEIRLMIYSLGKTIESFEKDLEAADEDSDERGNLLNDLTLCDGLMDKLKQMEAQKVKDIQDLPPLR